MIRREFLVTTALGTAGALATSMSGGEPSNQDMSTDVDGMPLAPMRTERASDWL